jgi:hypothetical protein
VTTIPLLGLGALSQTVIVTAKHSAPDGTKLGYQRICNNLRAERKTSVTTDEVLADRVREHFNGDLATAPNRAFMYQKSGKWYTMRKPDKIMQAWRKLLDTDAALAQTWDNIVGAGTG